MNLNENWFLKKSYIVFYWRIVFIIEEHSNLYYNRRFLCFVQTIWIDKKNVHVGKITVRNTYKGYKSVQKYLLKFKILLMKGMLLNFFRGTMHDILPFKDGKVTRTFFPQNVEHTQVKLKLNFQLDLCCSLQSYLNRSDSPARNWEICHNKFFLNIK